MFMIRYKDTEDGEYTEVEVRPAPTAVDYPESRYYTSKTTPDNNVVIFRPLRDDRPRRWLWSNYRSYMPGYRQLWNLLTTIEYRNRVRRGVHPIVEIWEDETESGGFGRILGEDTKVWTKVKVVQADRSVRPGGGRGVVYDDTHIEFLVVDPDYQEF